MHAYIHAIKTRIETTRTSRSNEVRRRFDTPVIWLYHQVAERRGKKKALVAAGRELLTVCYSVLKHRRPYFNPLHVQA
jgi:hypothetical protein